MYPHESHCYLLVRHTECQTENNKYICLTQSGTASTGRRQGYPTQPMHSRPSKTPKFFGTSGSAKVQCLSPNRHAVHTSPNNQRINPAVSTIVDNAITFTALLVSSLSMVDVVAACASQVSLV